MVVAIPGPAIRFCHNVLCFLARLFVCFFICFVSLVIVVVFYRAMQRVTVIRGLNCTKKLDFPSSSLHSHSAFELWDSVIFSVYLQQSIDCVSNLPLNERQCLVQTKKGVNMP